MNILKKEVYSIEMSRGDLAFLSILPRIIRENRVEVSHDLCKFLRELEAECTEAIRL